ncbi:hypothetical protein B0H63DRAFT_460427 [Podospora didyma]|uniref:Uncharacterized protein n=1 Tax=Podospora didyma TaxID=330526 RepID=A0AAE0P6M7_9PEZI|nr:hypothetical protein B0H63DRAFT_460427 [Podospora didyma]
MAPLRQALDQHGTVPTSASASSFSRTEVETLSDNIVLSPPSLTDMEKYVKMPLPPLPPKRLSLASNLSKEINQAFETPEGSLDSDVDHKVEPDHNIIDWDREEAKVSVILDKHSRQCSGSAPRAIKRPQQRKSEIAIDIPNTPPDDILSPQPRSSVQKILRLTSLKPRMSRSSCSAPSGHNPDHKIKQLTGLDVSSSEPYCRSRETAPVSPMSDKSSIFSSGDGTGTSEANSLDLNINQTSKGFSSDPTLNYLNPRQLERISSEPPVRALSPLGRLPRGDNNGDKTQSSPRPTTKSSAAVSSKYENSAWFRGTHETSQEKECGYRQDLYHATASQLARKPAVTPPSPSSQGGGVRPPRHDRRPSHETSMHSPNCPRYLDGRSGVSGGSNNSTRLGSPSAHQLSPPKIPSPRRSGGRSASEHSSSQSPQTRSSSTFGGGHRNKSPNPPSVSGGLSGAKYESESGDMDEANTGRSGHRSSRRLSLLSKVFNSKRASVGSSYSHLSPPTTNDSSLQGQQQQRDNHISTARRSGGSSKSGVAEEYSRSGESSFHLPDAAMASMSSLANKTNEIIEQAKVVAGIRSQAEKRRESLKSKIRVMSDGGQVIGTPPEPLLVPRARPPVKPPKDGGSWL